MFDLTKTIYDGWNLGICYTCTVVDLEDRCKKCEFRYMYTYSASYYYAVGDKEPHYWLARVKYTQTGFYSFMLT